MVCCTDMRRICRFLPVLAAVLLLSGCSLYDPDLILTGETPETVILTTAPRTTEPPETEPVTEEPSVSEENDAPETLPSETFPRETEYCAVGVGGAFEGLMTLPPSGIDLDDEDYRTLVKGLAAGETTVHFDRGISKDVLSSMVERASIAHPELFWYNSWTVSKASSWAEVQIDIMGCCGDLPAMSAELDAAAQELIAKIPAGLDDYGTALFVHDYIAQTTEYDTAGAASVGSGLYSTAYGCLVQHKAVCSGYAKAYQLIMQRLGYNCGYCTGDMFDGESHAWNYLRLNGAYYWIDVTHDDPVAADDSESLGITHAYFLINNDLLLRTRTIDDGQPFVPNCQSMEDNYYIRQRVYFEEYTFDRVSTVIASNVRSRRVEMMFGTDEAYQAALRSLITEGAIWDIPIVSGTETSIRYRQNDEMRVLTIAF